MKKIIKLLFFSLFAFSAYGQITDNTLEIQSNQIKNETTPGANTANRVGTLFYNLSTSKVNIIYGVTASGTDTYTATVSSSVVTYVTGQHFLILFTNGNTGAATINLNGNGAKSIVKNGSTALGAGDIGANTFHIIAYDGTNFQLLTQDDNTGGGGGLELQQKTETGTTYTVTDADHFYIINFSNASGVDVTLPNTLSEGTYVVFQRLHGAGEVQFVDDGTSQLNFDDCNDCGTLSIMSEGLRASWFKRDATNFDGDGALGPRITTSYIDGKVENDLAGNETDIAPAKAAVNTALALKAALASPTFTGTPAGPTAAGSTNSTQLATTAFVKASSPKVLIVAASDETTALTTGTGKITFRMPYAMTVTGVRASVTTAQGSGSTLTVDINEAGTTILSTKLTIDNSEKTSTTAASAAVISDTALADDAEITVDIDQVGTSPAGLKVTLIGY
jgi:hypothetical protein